MSSKKHTKATIPVSQYERVGEVTRSIPGLSLTKMVRMGLRHYLQEVEREGFETRTIDGRTITKAPGEPYPEREGGISRGRPVGGGQLSLID